MNPSISRVQKHRKFAQPPQKIRAQFAQPTHQPSPTGHPSNLEETVEMVRIKELQGNMDGYGFIHADPVQIVQWLTPGARDMLGHLRLLDYITNLTVDMDMDLVIRARVSFDQERRSISILGLVEEPLELFLSAHLLSQALGIPEGGLLTRKTNKTRARC